MAPIVRQPSVALNDRVGLNKLMVNLFPRKTRSVDMSHADHRQSLIELHRSFYRLLQCEALQKEVNQRRAIFHVRVRETS